MKIRIKGNSIRYRLTQSDIASFEKNGFLEEKTEFLNSPAFIYRLEIRSGIRNLEASFSGNRVCIFVPGNIAGEWITTDAIGFDNKMNIGNGKELYLLIEKDFVCIDHTLEDQSDNYPNPNKSLPGGSQVC
jgi:uncharacterized protein DUF7009